MKLLVGNTSSGIRQRFRCRITATLILLLGSLASFGQGIVTENFDSGSLATGPSGWQVRNVLQPLGGSVSDTFVDNGAGKAFRMQRGSINTAPLGAPQAYGTGRAWLYRTNQYSDFYVVMDLVAWNNGTNQALVLLARASGFDVSAIPGGPPGLGGVSGYVCNYNCIQDGTGAGDRLGGEFQINRVTGEAPTTIAVATVNLILNRSYRMVFKGLGVDLTAQLYDSEDLTTPLVTITASDAAYESGASGIAIFHRDSGVHPNLTDMTVDNFYAAPTDPNTDIAPAIRSGFADLPQVVTRTPTNRFANFHPMATGISFQARTFSAAQIDASATKLFLNGVDKSSSLAPLPANGSTVNLTTAAGAVENNQVYSARIILSDTTGALKSTNTFWFDTFAEGTFLTVPARTIEVEDYNYEAGKFVADPIPVSGVDGTMQGIFDGYFTQTGTPDVDFFKVANGFVRVRFQEYRPSDRVQITQGSWFFNTSDDEAGDIGGADLRIHDIQRARYVTADVKEYQVRLTSPGDWFNYTRNFEPGNYRVYLRAGAFIDTEAYLDRVTSDPKVASQTTSRLGTFRVANRLSRLNYTYTPLMTGSGPTIVSLSGESTLRLTIGGVAVKDERAMALDYLVFIPTTKGPTLFDDFADGNDTANPPWEHFDPIGGLTAPAATFQLANGAYHLVAPTPLAADAGPARAGSFVGGAAYEEFYVSVDIIDFNDTIRQAFGVAARVNDPGLGTTGGYLFSWEPGGGTLPGTTNGDLDVSRLVNEAPVAQIETPPSGLHLTKGKSYRFVFMGKGFDFEALVYELPDTANPIKRMVAHDTAEMWASGQVGLVVADQSASTLNQGDATFDNFLATWAEPKLTSSLSGNTVTITWPQIPFRLQSTGSLTPAAWADVTTGIGQVGDQNSYSTTASSSTFYRLIY